MIVNAPRRFLFCKNIAIQIQMQLTCDRNLVLHRDAYAVFASLKQPIVWQAGERCFGAICAEMEFFTGMKLLLIELNQNPRRAQS